MAILNSAAMKPARQMRFRGQSCVLCKGSFVAELSVLLSFCLGQVVPAQTTQPGRDQTEYRFKAEFLYNFTKLVEWPTNAFSSADSPMTIGILGKDPFGSLLDDLVSGKKIEGRPVTVKRFKWVEDVKGCHVLFIGASEEKRIPLHILPHLRGKPILTVGETEDFLEHGGVIRFVNVDGKVRFQVRLGSADRQGLKLSSKLLFLSKPLYRPPGEIKTTP